METLDGIQDALDVIGLVWDYADVVNLIISVCRGDWERAAWSFVGTLPLACSLIARAGRGVTKTSKAIAGKIITGAANAATGARTVVKELELTIGSLGELKQYERLTLDVLEDLKGATKTLSELPAGFKTEKVCLQFADGSYVNINVIVRYADDIINAVKTNQRSVIASVENSTNGAKGLSNIQKGNYGEMKMDVYFESLGYERIGGAELLV